MLEQVWKNVARQEFPAITTETGIQVSIKKGCQCQIGDFAKVVDKVEQALGKKVKIIAVCPGNGEMLLNIALDEPVKVSVPKKAAPKKPVEIPEEVVSEE